MHWAVSELRIGGGGGGGSHGLPAVLAHRRHMLVHHTHDVLHARVQEQAVHWPQRVDHLVSVTPAQRSGVSKQG